MYPDFRPFEVWTWESCSHLDWPKKVRKSPDMLATSLYHGPWEKGPISAAAVSAAGSRSKVGTPAPHMELHSLRLMVDPRFMLTPVYELGGGFGPSKSGLNPHYQEKAPMFFHAGVY